MGIKTENRFEQMAQMDKACYDEAARHLRNGHQVMVFVHARNATGRIAAALRDIAREYAFHVIIIFLLFAFSPFLFAFLLFSIMAGFPSS